MRNIAIAIMLLFSSISYAQVARIRVQVVWTNASGREFSADAYLDDWEATWDGSSWVATIQHSLFGSNGLLTTGRIICNEVDIESTDSYHGLMLTDSNSWKASQHIYIDTSGGDTNIVPFWVLRSSSPEFPMSVVSNAIHQQIATNKFFRGKFESEMKANPNSIPALRAAVKSLAASLGYKLHQLE